MAKTTDRVLHAAENAWPYVDRALQDEELAEDLRSAFTAARDIYRELSGLASLGGVAQRLATDKEVQEHLRTAAEELRHASRRLQAKESHRTRYALLLLTGIAIGILFNPVTGPETRRWLKEQLFGENGLGSEPRSANSGAAF